LGDHHISKLARALRAAKGAITNQKARACAFGCEGIVSKRLGTACRSGPGQRLAQDQESRSTGGKARSRRGLERQTLATDMKLTKIDVAEAQIRAAVWMYFRGEHPVPVYTLANAAREIVPTNGEQVDIETV